MYDQIKYDFLKYMSFIEGKGEFATRQKLHEQFPQFCDSLLSLLFKEGFVCQPNLPIQIADDLESYDFDTIALTETGYLYLENHLRVKYLTDQEKNKEFFRGLIIGLLSGTVPQMIYMFITLLLQKQ